MNKPAITWPPRHATLWLDTEFNGWGGELISLALVDDSDRQFYEVVDYPATIEPWVLANVLPVLGLRPVPLARMQAHLAAWLSAYDSVHIVADWPDDVAYLCRALITGPGERLDTPALSFEIRRDLDAVSAIPHNALEDAKAMRARHLQLIAGSGSVQASERCERKDPRGCWHVRCQLGGRCQHRFYPNDPAAQARGWGEGGESCVDALNAQERLRNLARYEDAERVTSGAGVAGAESASGASLVAAAERPREPVSRIVDTASTLLALVGIEAPVEVLATYTGREVADAANWAGAVHLHAGDNDDVEVPPRPAFLPEPWSGPWQGEGVFATNPTPLTPRPLAGGVQWPVTDEYVDAIGYEAAAPAQHVIEGCCGLLQCPGCPTAAEARK